MHYTPLPIHVGTVHVCTQLASSGGKLAAGKARMCHEHAMGFVYRRVK
jgi:hypothetical protein